MRARFAWTGLLVCALAQAADSNRIAVLEVEVENSVSYRYDVADLDKRATSATPVTVTIDRAFADFCLIDDIVAVNGKPAKGLHMSCGTRMAFGPSPRPGFAIADVSMGNGRQECNWELYTAGGQFVGRLVDGGFFPHSVQGGAGAYFGATGEHQTQAGAAGRLTSVAEDPSMRRVNGGTRYKVTFYIVPRYWPEVMIEAAGPAVFHADDWSRVTDAKPARAGELLMVWAKGLGPTRPALIPPGTRPFSAEPPYEQVNSPIEAAVNGIDGQVISAIGWPGSMDLYRVDFRVPERVQPGAAKLRLTSAWIAADEVTIRIQ
jgi:uncharacterized protein (TIGR03437 family)